MKRFLLFSILILLPVSIILSQEPTCTVLVKELTGTYQGDCKKGLANGKGTAKGVDSYTGSFKKGFPNGKGIYTWAAGDRYDGYYKMGIKEGEGVFHTQIDGRDTIITGIWKEDKYIGPKPISPEVLLNIGVKSVSFSKKGDGAIVTLMFMQVGTNSSGISNLIIFESSGTEFRNGPYQGYENVSFPFKARITYRTMNAFKTGFTDCVLEFKITQPGRWDVRISN
jgi:hypothetical protein